MDLGDPSVAVEVETVGSAAHIGGLLAEARGGDEQVTVGQHQLVQHGALKAVTGCAVLRLEVHVRDVSLRVESLVSVTMDGLLSHLLDKRQAVLQEHAADTPEERSGR